jgi:nitrate/TMAO reductase-like tetraheme cytochrome c subunit
MGQRKGALTMRIWWILMTGLFLFFPSASGQAPQMSESDFTSAQTCGQCHREIYSQWTQSMHSQSLTDPIYRAVIDEMIRQTGESQKTFCLSCHAPIASVSGKLLEMPGPMDWEAFSDIAGEGVTCDFCHTISGTEKLGKNIFVGAYVYPRRGTTGVKYGRHPDAQSAAHETQFSAFLLSSEMCAVCHKFKHPMGGVEIQSTYDEWARGPYRRQGVRCQDCHMPVYSGTTVEGGKERDEIHSHLFIGGHTEMVKKAATLSVWGVATQEASGTRLAVHSNVVNSGAGHAIPTGIPGVREMWLDIEVLSPEGARLAQRRFRYGQRFVKQDGSEALPWEPFVVLEENRIEPKQAKQTQFELVLPGQVNEVKIRANLFMRLISEAMAQRLNLVAPEPVLMTSAEAIVTVE